MNHVCEYMSRATFVIFGRTVQNFAACISGVFAYVYHPRIEFKKYCNLSMVTLHRVEKANIETEIPKHLNLADEVILKTLIKNHCLYTNSKIAKIILDHWEKELGNFIKVMPMEYKRALNEMREHKTKETV